MVRICTGIWRVSSVRLNWLSTFQPSMSGRNMSSDMATGWYSSARSSASAPRDVTSAFSPAACAASTRMPA